MAKRKKGAQRVPTKDIKEHSMLIKFVAQAVCFKKDDKYLAQQVFMDAARVIDGGKCDWAKMLEKAMITQMTAIKEKGQKLYTYAPIWQELCKHVKGREAEKKRSRETKSEERTPKKAKMAEVTSPTKGTTKESSRSWEIGSEEKTPKKGKMKAQMKSPPREIAKESSSQRAEVKSSPRETAKESSSPTQAQST